MGEDGWNPAHTKRYDFTKIEFFIAGVPQNAGITWSDTGVSKFTQTGWTAQTVNPTYVSATGPKVTDTMFWNSLFTGTVPKDFRLDYLVYDTNNGSQLKLRYGISMNIKNGIPDVSSNGWTALDLKNLPSYNRTPAAVPIPPTVLLLGAGLIGVVVLRKRIHI
ncbi:MAG: hypothetical protein C0399_08945 [Syntrophus sp. (in: bacteria)]|nr:hypothetical protein [Syntrophus sp. (in: bacteria)]